MSKSTLSKRALHVISHFGQYNRVLNCGPFRNGKTYVNMMAFGLYCKDLQEAGITGLKFCLAGQTVRNIKSVMGDALSELFGTNFNYYRGLKDGKSKDATLFGQNIWFAGLKDKSSEGGWRGQTFFGVIHDECTLCSEENLMFLLGRISGNYSQYNFPDWVKPMFYVGMCNPDSPVHHIKKKMDDGWFDKIYEWKRSDAKYPGAKEYYKQKMIEYKDNELFYQRYIEGKWVSADGLVWSSFNYKKNVINIEDVDIDYKGFKRLIVGIDWGSNHATALEVVGYSDTEEYVCLEEHIFKNMAPSDLAENILPILNSLPFISQIYVDGAGKAYNDELTKASVKYINAIKGHEYIPKINSLFSIDKLFVISSCKQLISDIYGYKYKENSIDDSINRINDDTCDALRYAVISDMINNGIM